MSNIKITREVNLSFGVGFVEAADLIGVDGCSVVIPDNFLKTRRVSLTEVNVAQSEREDVLLAMQSLVKIDKRNPSIKK